MAGPGNILIKIGADAGQAVRELGTVDKALGSTMSTHEKMSAGLKKAALPAAAALGAIGFAAVDATKAAMEDAAAQDHLAGVLKRTAGATDAQIKSTEAYITATARATGVSDDDLRPALENLVTATGSVSKGQKEMQQALDISAASGKDVVTVSKAMALAHTGSTMRLSKLIPGLSEAAKKSKDYSVIMSELADKTGGAMARSTETAAGQMRIMSDQTKELKESLGYALLPVVEALLPLLVSLGDFAAHNTKVIEILVGAVAALAGGILIANAAMKVYQAASIAVKAATAAWTAAQWLLNAALNANPIGLVVIALAALAAGIYLAYTRSSTFRAIVGAAMDEVAAAIHGVVRGFDAVLDAARSAFNWIVAHWQLALFAFGPIGAAAYLIATNFDKVKAAGTGAFNAIHDAIWSVIHAVENLIDWISKIHIPKIHIPHIPGVNLVAPTATAPGFRTAPGVVAATGAGGGVTVNVYGAVDPEGTARAIRRILAAHDRRQGRTA